MGRQFLRRGMQLDRGVASEFLVRVFSLTNIYDINSCFPLPAIHSNGPISNFYRFYGIDN